MVNYYFTPGNIYRLAQFGKILGYDLSKVNLKQFLKISLKDKNYKIGDVISLKIDNQELSARWCENYKNETIGAIGIVVDSWGMVSIFLSNGNAQKLLNCKDDSKVIIKG